MTNRPLVVVVATTVALVASGGLVAASIATSDQDGSEGVSATAPEVPEVSEVRETVAPGALGIASRVVTAGVVEVTSSSVASLAVESPLPTAAPAAAAEEAGAPADTTIDVPATTAPVTTASGPPGRLRISSTTLDLGASETVVAFSVVNVGGRPVDVRVDGDPTPFVVAGGTGTLGPGQGAQIAVVLDRTNLTEGDYGTTLALVGATTTPIVVTARVERPPLLALLGAPDPTEQEVCDLREVGLAVEAGDESGVATVVADLSGPTGSGSVELVQEGPWFLALVPPPVVGEWRVDITATDVRGNSASLTTTFMVAPCTDDDPGSLLA